MVVVVDDSASVDQEVFNMEAYEGADWVRISDEVPVDSDALDTALERSRRSTTPAAMTSSTRSCGRATRRSRPRTELEPDPDPEELE